MIPRGNQYPEPAWNGNPFRLSVDGLNGDRTMEQGDSPNGQLNLGHPFQLPQAPDNRGGFQPGQLGAVPYPVEGGYPRGTGGMPQGGGLYQPHDVRGILQALLQHSGDQGFHPDIRPQTGQPVNAQAPWDTHHGMVNAASNLARFLAQQHTAGLRRYQYNGRN